MKVLRQVFTAVIVLVLAVVIVDCNCNPQEAMDEKISKLVPEQPVAAAITTPKVEHADEQNQRAVDKSQAKREEEDRNCNSNLRKAPDEQTSKMIPEQLVAAATTTPKVEHADEENRKVADSSQDKREEKDRSCKSNLQETPDEQTSKLAPGRPVVATSATPEVEYADEENQKAADNSQDERKEKSRNQEEKLAKEQSHKFKPEKKVKAKGAKRDKRETKKSGSGKNGKTKRSAEKSKKYESKKKSKK